MENKIQVSKLKLFYGEHLALNKVSINVAKNSVLALIGPEGAGKTHLAHLWAAASGARPECTGPSVSQFADGLHDTSINLLIGFGKSCRRPPTADPGEVRQVFASLNIAGSSRCR